LLIWKSFLSEETKVLEAVDVSPASNFIDIL